MFSTISSRFHQNFWEKNNAEGIVSTLLEQKFLTERLMWTPSKNFCFFRNRLNRKRFSHFSIWDTYTKNFAARFLVIPHCKLEILQPHITLKFSKNKSWVSLSRYRYNCMQYMRLREYMHCLRTQSRFKLCMQLADSVQYVIDVLVREK